MNIIWDCETYPNCYLMCAHNTDMGVRRQFEISQFVDQTDQLLQFIGSLDNPFSCDYMIGFNSLGFDYPILHMIWQMKKVTPQQIYKKAMAIINAPDSAKFQHMIWPSDRRVPQIDLFKIHHFDNKARMTSLKALQFNMKMKNIRDLPFPPGTVLTEAQVDVLREYCWNDVEATRLFYEQSKDMIDFRFEMSKSLPTGDVLNYSDVKLGKSIFQHHLEKAGVQCYEFGPTGRIPKQTPRPIMHLADCVPPYVQFANPEFDGIKRYFQAAVVTQTKGAFDGLVAKVGGLEFVFGQGGIHASVENERFEATKDMMILDIDVTGMYPAFAIENGLFPEHLGPKFVEVYRHLREKRAEHKKGSTANAALKLAMNGVYGASGDKFSIFYDPLFTMKVTVGGQLVMANLAERLLQVEGLRIIQANTDGITMYLPRTAKFIVDWVCAEWSRITKLQLESVEYQTMCIADVNSYIAKTVDGKVKRKGRYEYDVEWHQNASMLVVPKVAEKVLLDGAKLVPTLRQWPDVMDFMARVKVPRNSILVGADDDGERPLENTQRYYASTRGVYLFKYMPPLAKNPNEWRRLGVMAGQKVVPCNDLLALEGQMINIDFHWYEKEIEKLTLGVM